MILLNSAIGNLFLNIFVKQFLFIINERNNKMNKLWC